MPPVHPYWFTQRQAKAEEAGANIYRLTAPNLKESFITIRQEESGRWLGALRYAADGQDEATTGAQYDNPADAWYGAFELYRNAVVVGA